MKKLFFFLLSICIPLLAFTQSSAVTLQAEQALASYQSTYQLNSDQRAQMLDIQQQYFQKEAQLSELKTKDMDRYLSKVITLRKVTESSIFQLLNEQQQAIFSRKQEERTQKQTALRKKLNKAGASQIEIKKALLELNQL
jgi:hypothetical protein